MSTPAAEGPRIRHLLPGRVRIHWPAWSGQAGPALEAHLSRLPGVISARANPLLNTLLIYFDPRVTDEKILLEALRTGQSGKMSWPHAIPAALPSAPHSPATHSPATLPLPSRGRPEGKGGRAALAVRLATAAKFLAIFQRLPLIRDALRHLLGGPLADLLLVLTRTAAALLAGEPLDLILAAADSILPLPPPPRLLLAG